MLTIPIKPFRDNTPNNIRSLESKNSGSAIIITGCGFVCTDCTGQWSGYLSVEAVHCTEMISSERDIVTSVIQRRLLKL